MRVLERTLTTYAADADGLVLSTTSATPTLVTTTLNPARRLTVASAGDISARVFTFTGTDRAGNAITETVTGVNNNAVTTRQQFATVSSVTVDAVAGTAYTIGWTATGYSAPIIVGQMREAFGGAIGVQINGSATIEVEATMINLIRDKVVGDYWPDVFELTGAALTANGYIPLTGPVAFIRLRADSMAAGNSAILRFIPGQV